MDVPTAAFSLIEPSQSAAGISGVLAACKDSGGPTDTLDQLLKLDEMLEKGYAPIWASEERWRMFLEAFCALTEVRPAEAFASRAPCACVLGACRAARVLVLERLLGLATE